MSRSRLSEVREATKSMDFAKTRFQIQLNTSKGGIRLDLYPDVAPKHCLNMLGLVKIGFYNGLLFHRIVKKFVIQGGCPEGTGTGGPGYKVDAEFNARPHDPGVLSMARAQDPNSAGSQFFLCLEKVPFLDKNYTAFGKVADDASLAVVQAIGAVATGSGDRPVEEVKIVSAEVIESPL